MLNELKSKGLPTVEDLSATFGKVADPHATLRHLTVKLDDAIVGQGSVEEKLQRVRDFINDNKSSILKAFNNAGAISFTGMPTKFLGKVYPEISVWIRDEDTTKAVAALSAQPWCADLQKGNTYIIGQSLHR